MAEDIFKAEKSFVNRYHIPVNVILGFCRGSFTLISNLSTEGRKICYLYYIPPSCFEFGF